MRTVHDLKNKSVLITEFLSYLSRMLSSSIQDVYLQTVGFGSSGIGEQYRSDASLRLENVRYMVGVCSAYATVNRKGHAALIAAWESDFYAMLDEMEKQLVLRGGEQ